MVNRNTTNMNQPNSPIDAFMQRFNMFKNGFHGDPNQKIQELLNSGQISQEQYNRAAQQAKMIQQLFNK